MKKLLFLPFLLVFGSLVGQEIGLKVGHATPNRGKYTDRDFTAFFGLHLVPKVRMNVEIGARDLFSSEANFNTFPSQIGRIRHVNLMVGAGFFGEVFRVGRRSQINVGGGFQLTRRSRVFGQIDWTRYRLGGGNAGFRLALQPIFSNFANFNDFFGTGGPDDLPKDLPVSLGVSASVFHYFLPKTKN